MPFNLDDMLVVAITSRALFHLQESDPVYRVYGLDAYRAHQREREGFPLDPARRLPLVRGLLAINDRAGEQLQATRTRAAVRVLKDSNAFHANRTPAAERGETERSE